MTEYSHPTPSQILLHHLKNVFEVFRLGENLPPTAKSLAEKGFDPLFFVFRFYEWEVSLNREFSRCFSLETRVSLTLTTSALSTNGIPKVEAEVNWSSGGGSTSTALAQASHHMEILHRTAQAELILQHALRDLRKGDDLKVALKDLNAMAEKQREEARAAMKAEEKTETGEKIETE